MVAIQLPWPTLSTLGASPRPAPGLGLYYHLVDPEPRGVAPDDA